ncbi:MAG: hypothetical protein WHT08_14625 [Bryobacteraceae bacterium]
MKRALAAQTLFRMAAGQESCDARTPLTTVTLLPARIRDGMHDNPERAET